MSVNWTAEQQQVISLRNRNILVSAAAGSGKTAVLVERIIQMLTDTKNPIDVDRLLVVTFTEAAAAEMKERVRNAIEKELQKHPENTHLQRQSALIHTAKITTIHSFCLSVIREYFHVIDLDPGFRTGEEGELKLLRQDVIDELLESCYEEGNDGFLNLSEKLGNAKSDKKLGELILKVYDYSRSYPQPEKWLSYCVAQYEVNAENFEESAFTVFAKEQISLYRRDMENFLEEGLRICEEPDGPYLYAETLESDMEQINKLKQAETYRELYEKIETITWAKLSGKRDAAISPEKREYVKGLREKVKNTIKQLKKDCFYAKPEELISDMEGLREDVRIFTSLVDCFYKSFTEKKRNKHIIDFSDMEHLALQILTENRDGRLIPSAIAAEYQEQFVEVMIDEYQDSNLIQETLLTSVSKISRGQYNVFMVGDVKQSIYSFRLSRPELFMEKYHTYSKTDSYTQRIDLHKNFRSRTEVLDSVNYIFERIMNKELGGIMYDEEAALYPGADYEPSPEKDGISENRTELLLIPDTMLKEMKEKEKITSARKLEAQAVAEKIHELVEFAQVIDKKTGKRRKASYGDIVILTRSMKGWAEEILEVLSQEQIPAFSTGGEGYFSTYEIRILLDFLRILDNQKQDLPLTAVLTSPFVGFHVGQLAKIREAYPEIPFYEAAERYAQEKNDEALKQFYEMLGYYRRKVPFTSIDELLRKIIEETDFGLYMTAMPGGVQRIANIEMLVEKAAAFGQTSYKGLFNFVRYIEQLQEYQVDYSEANIMDEQADTVRIMSIHKSKGLEFPIVILMGMNKKFNISDSKETLVIHPELGIGMDAVDLERRTKMPSMQKVMIKRMQKMETLGEELRILYVALTRAKERLIMTGMCKEKEIWAEDKTEVFSVGNMLSTDKYMDWVLPIAQKAEAPIRVTVWKPGERKMGSAQKTAEIIAREVLLSWNSNKIWDKKLKESLEKKFQFTYLYETEKQMKQKLTVSELKKRAFLAEEAGEIVIEEPEVVPLLPKFVQQEETLTGALKGSAYHKFLEILDFTIPYDKEVLQWTIETFQEQGRLSKEAAKSIREQEILHFLNSSLGQRMYKAACLKKLRREQPFVLSVQAEEIYPEAKGEDRILVQGIIDSYFEEEDGLVLVDYKTDRIKSVQELVDKYRAQLDYYAKALEQLTKKKVKQKLIYSFAIGQEIEV